VHDSDCSRVFALLSEYLDQELEPATCAELEEHLSGCPECVEFIQGLKRSMQLCQQLGKRMPAPHINDEAMASLRRAYAQMLARRRASPSGISST
jgi:RNA polymerase sigma-70 factor (ECF subfamily)